MKKKLFAVAMGAVLGSSFLMAKSYIVADELEKYENHTENDEKNLISFVHGIIELAEHGDIQILDYYSDNVAPSVAGLPMTKDELENVFFQNHNVTAANSAAILRPGKINKIDEKTFEVDLEYLCNYENDEIEQINTKPVVIVVENGKYRVRSIPKQPAVCEKEIKDGSIKIKV